MVSVIVIVTATLLVGYSFLIETYRRWFLKIQPYTSAGSKAGSITISVIIPARNEEAMIEACLSSVLQQEYPDHLFEVIVIDDHSTDNTAATIKNLQQHFANLKLIQLEKLLDGLQLNSYKKKAIEYAISQATGDWIITTDADCIVTKSWLSTIASFINDNDCKFVAAPVKFTNNESFVSIFQCLDFMTLQGITAASVNQQFHSMCNGANLAYSKQAFYEVGGFAGIDSIASGDDMLLMHKIYNKFPNGVKYLFCKDVIVKTPPMPNWRSFINQRIRWASKADKYDDKRITAVLMLVYLFNASFIVMAVVAFLKPVLFIFLVGLLLCKTLVELRFLYPVAAFFSEQPLLWWFPVMQPVHVLYTVIAGWLGKFGKYTWKGRTVK